MASVVACRKRSDGSWEIIGTGAHLTDKDLPGLCKEITKQIASKGQQAFLVDLSDNSIGDAGVKALMETLAALQLKVIRLKLFRNKIGNAGAVAVGDFLLKMGQFAPRSHMLEVHLSHNFVGAAGVKHLCRAVAAAGADGFPLYPRISGGYAAPLWLRVEHCCIERAEETLRTLETDLSQLRHNCGYGRNWVLHMPERGGRCSAASCAEATHTSPVIHVPYFDGQSMRRIPPEASLPVASRPITGSKPGQSGLAKAAKAARTWGAVPAAAVLAGQSDGPTPQAAAVPRDTGPAALPKAPALGTGMDPSSAGQGARATRDTGVSLGAAAKAPPAGLARGGKAPPAGVPAGPKASVVPVVDTQPKQDVVAELVEANDLTPRCQKLWEELQAVRRARQALPAADSTCPICLESSSVKPRRSAMAPCGHVLCEACADAALFPAHAVDTTIMCPICKAVCLAVIKIE